MIVVSLLMISVLARSTPAFGFALISPRTRASRTAPVLRPPSRTSTTSSTRAVVLTPPDKSSSSLKLIGGKEAGPFSGFFSGPSSFFLSSVEFFDGSTIVDPVVVSGAFWTSLKAKLLSLVLGELVATLIFGMVVLVAASQLGKLTENLSRTFPTGPSAASTSTNRFRKFPESQSPPVQIQREDVVRLLISILVDLIGTSSELVPVVGELSDVVWAPIAGLIVRSLYGSNVVLIFEVAEEILPFTDFLPFATICWTVDVFFADSDMARALRIGAHRDANVGADPRDRSQINGELPAKAPGRVLDVKGVSVEDDLDRLKSSEQPNPGD